MSYLYHRSSTTSYLLYDSNLYGRDVISNVNTLKHSLLIPENENDSGNYRIRYSITPKLTRNKKQGLSFALVNPSLIQRKNSPFGDRAFVKINVKNFDNIDYIKQLSNESSTSYNKHLLKSVVYKSNTINSLNNIKCYYNKETLNESDTSRVNSLRKRKRKFNSVYQKNKTLQYKINSNTLAFSTVQKYIDFDSTINRLSSKIGKTLSKHKKQNQTSKNNITTQLDMNKKCHYRKKFGPFAGFCAFTFKNDQDKINDKVDIYINKKLGNDNNNKEQISLHYFGLHHGIGGDKISKLIKDSFHCYLFNHPELLTNTIKCINHAYDKIELKAYKQVPESHECGSSSLTAFIAGKKMHIANIGNSKCIISLNHSFEMFNVVNTHSPKNINEMLRLQNNGIVFKYNKQRTKYQIFPLGISSSRIVGCFAMKGIIPYSHNKQNITCHNILTTINKGGIISVPEITEVNITNDMDFILIVNDIISFYLSNKDIALIIYTVMLESLKNNTSYETMIDVIINTICKESIDKGAKYNLSLIFIPFERFNDLYEGNNIKKVSNILTKLNDNVNDFEALYPKCFIHREILKMQKNCTLNIVNGKSIMIKQNENEEEEHSMSFQSESKNSEERFSKLSLYKGFKCFECEGGNDLDIVEGAEISILSEKKNGNSTESERNYLKGNIRNIRNVKNIKKRFCCGCFI